MSSLPWDAVPHDIIMENLLWHCLLACQTRGRGCNLMAHLSFCNEHGRKHGKGLRGSIGKWRELIKRERLLSQAGISLWLHQGGRWACFPAADLQQEAHRGNSGRSPLSKCDGHFDSQIAFSSLAHARQGPSTTTGCKAHPMIRLGLTLKSHPQLLNCS